MFRKLATKIRTIKPSYVKWNFYGTIVVILISLTLLYFAIPKPDLDIFFDPYYNNLTFAISNLGDKPVTDVKVSYELACQRIKQTPEYINLDVPTLTESNGINPTYTHTFDQDTKRIIDNYLSHYSLCGDLKKSLYFLPYSKIRENVFNGTFFDSFKVWMCDPCRLRIEVESNKQSVEEDYKLYNPMELSFNISCIPNEIEYCEPDPLHGIRCKATEFGCSITMINSNNMTIFPSDERLFRMRDLGDGIEYKFVDKDNPFG